MDGEAKFWKELEGLQEFHRDAVMNGYSSSGRTRTGHADRRGNDPHQKDRATHVTLLDCFPLGESVAVQAPLMGLKIEELQA